jgi:hypothetical protein
MACMAAGVTVALMLISVLSCLICCQGTKTPHQVLPAAPAHSCACQPAAARPRAEACHAPVQPAKHLLLCLPLAGKAQASLATVLSKLASAPVLAIAIARAHMLLMHCLPRCRRAVAPPGPAGVQAGRPPPPPVW